MWYAGPVTYVITLILGAGGGLVGVFAAIDAISRRPDAFVAADKQTKGVWIGITVACGAVLGLGVLSALKPAEVQFFSPQSLLWLAALVGTLVYLLDVRPRLREVQRGSRW